MFVVYLMACAATESLNGSAHDSITSSSPPSADVGTATVLVGHSHTEEGALVPAWLNGVVVGQADGHMAVETRGAQAAMGMCVRETFLGNVCLCKLWRSVGCRLFISAFLPVMYSCVACKSGTAYLCVCLFSACPNEFVPFQRPW